MILAEIYEPTFSKQSHGFRPKRSCHTALEAVQTGFKGAKWIVEGDIEACFDSFDHHVLTELLRKRIQDEQFISLMWKFLKAGYMEQWTYKQTYSGTVQGSGMSPILANIYLNELDIFLTNYQSQFKSDKRAESEQYGKAEYQMKKARRELAKDNNKETVKAFKKAQQNKFNTPYRPIRETGYKQLRFCRYADDFVVGIIGSKEDAEQVKADIKQFLTDTLKLTLSDRKTKVTHSSELIRFLGYDFTVSRSKDVSRNKIGVLQRFRYGKVRLYVPYEKWRNKLLEYKTLKITTDKDGNENWKSIHRGFLINKTDVEIISKYNAEIRGLYNFYKLAVNVSVLNKFNFIMKGSMIRTFACKYKSSFKQIMKKYTKDDVFTVFYETKSGTKSSEYYHDGFAMQRADKAVDVDVLEQYKKYDRPNSLGGRLRSNKCEKCNNHTDDIHMHHIKRMKDLADRNDFEILMKKNRRKSLALCKDCYEELKHL